MTVVQEVLAKTTVPASDLEALSRERDELQAHQGQLLGVERALREHITLRLDEIGKEAATFLGAHENREAPLRVVDQSVLGWRHKHRINGIPVPKLALIDIRGNSIEIPGQRYEMDLPGPLGLWYRDIRDAAIQREVKKDRTRVRIIFHYAGAVPSEQRKMIREEIPNFERVYLLADAPLESWEYRDQAALRPVRVIHRDPLIVGYRYETLYLLGQFEPTPIEKYVELEFTSRPALTAGQG